MRGSRRLRKAIGGLRRRFEPAGIILMYHRVANLPSDPLSLAVSIEHFAQQLDYVAGTCQPVRLSDLFVMLQQGTLPKRAVAITFDDGYCDNYQNAYPLLVSRRIPATIFVTSDQIGSNQEFWWDDLERILLLSPRLPSRLRLPIRSQELEWQLITAEDRQGAYNTLHRALKPLSPDERQGILQQLTRWADLSTKGRAGYRALTRTELAEIAGCGLIEIGGHTRNHPQLAALTVDEQQAEISGGKQRLEALTGGSIEVFAYPYGQAIDFTEDTVAVVRRAGFRAALTTIHGYVEPDDNIFRLRRCAVHDWDSNPFRRKLEEFFVIRDRTRSDRGIEAHRSGDE